MLEYFFALSLFLILFAYFGYPVSLTILGIFKSKTNKKEIFYPEVTIIIAAYNEENMIEEKIKNTLSINYPRQKMQIIVTSDGSTDRTNEIAARYQNLGIELLINNERKGKENAQKMAVMKSKGEIIVFTDIGTRLDPLGVEQIVSNFKDSKIGCVSSEDRLIRNDGDHSGEGFYVQYEMWLRRLESKVNSVVGLSGSFFAARKTVCKDFSPELDSDFSTLLNCLKMGLRGICDPMAIGYYRDISNSQREFERKVRTVLRGITVFFKNTEFLNIFKYGLFSYQYFCHKLLRWLVPGFLIFEITTNIILAITSLVYFFILAIQFFIFIVVLFYRIGYFQFFSKSIKIPTYFLVVNAAIFVAWYRYFKQDRIIIWEPTRR